jgi:peptidyl-dipeptidase Dcp
MTRHVSDVAGEIAANPLLEEWIAPFGAPPFPEIKPEHFRPAFDAALASHCAEIAAIAQSDQAPSFENTIDALELSGRKLSDISAVFFNLAGADTNDAIQGIEREIAPVLAQHYTAIYMNPELWRRIEFLHARRDEIGLTAEQDRVLERYHTGFRRRGAALPEDKRARLAEISERLAVLGTTFSQNVLADEKAFSLVLDGERDLAGLPDWLRDAARVAAAERGMEGKQVITLSRSSIEPFLQFSGRRDLREAAFKAWSSRGENGGDTDNRKTIAEMVALRAERAWLLGYESFAHFRLEDAMAKTPEAALDLLRSVWTRAREKAVRDRGVLQEMIQADGKNFELAPWDWRYYAERQRKAEFDFDEDSIKPYLQLDKLIEAVFDTAQRLFGIFFRERFDVPIYHPDVRVWEVLGGDGRHLGLFFGDYFARPSKRSGAWMSGFRSQEKLTGNIRPIVINVTNFSKSSDGPTLLSFDDSRTLFHEFGHALHGLLSDLTYPMISGTSASRDFVEFPSQLYEHWLEQPELLRRFATHYRTGEPMPEERLKRLLAARNFNQGQATVEYVSCALVDLEFHLLSQEEARNLDVTDFERTALERIDMPEAITMRHRPPHFGHIFSGDGYSSAYYSYMWSEVLDADGFAAFTEAGDIYDHETAKRLHDYVYSAGYLRDPAEAYQSFRGRMPEPAALLRKRGLIEAPTTGEL